MVTGGVVWGNEVFHLSCLCASGCTRVRGQVKGGGEKQFLILESSARGGGSAFSSEIKIRITSLK